MSSRPRFYITTAIDYPNGSPHLGHAYEKIVTDAYARWYRMMGRDVFFLTGTDENGQKLAKSAEVAQKPTSEFVEENSELFKAFCKRLNLSNDDFIRTTEDRHIKITHEIWKKLEEKGEVFFGEYSGNYCLACEAFYPDSQAPDGNCPEHHTPLAYTKEEGFFLKMSHHHEWILNFLKGNPYFIVPSSSRKEILSRLELEPLKDLSISRPNDSGWGIPVPGKPEHVIYTWFDALINYYTATQEPKGREAYWPAQVHVIGRDIAWFHCVIWPILLHAAGLPLPEQVYVHGMILDENGRKMSKSLGNGIDPLTVLEKFPLDTFRYYLLKNISSQGDGRFSMTEIEDKHNNELANDFGNLIMRIVKLAIKKTGNELAFDGYKLDFDFVAIQAKIASHMDKREHHRALEVLWEEIKRGNVYVNDQAPWKFKDPADPGLRPVLYNCIYAIYGFAQLLRPFLPESAEKTLSVLGVSPAPNETNFTPVNFALKDPLPLFPKIITAPSVVE